MDNITIFDTSHGTQNMGDYIIMDSVNRELDFLLKKNFVTRYSTHTPIGRSYQSIKKGMVLKNLEKAKYKFIGGTNIFKNTLLNFNPDWNINIFNIKFYKDCISIGCGSALNAKKMNLYTKFIYKRILSKKYIHSTRDERTKIMLEKLGFQAINTGCATLWGLTKEHCEKIPTKKAQNVVFTLTDYKKDKDKDQALVNILVKNYNKVYFWVQGSDDYDYFNSLQNISSIEIIYPNLKDYAEILDSGVDYVGTRLHAGIFAMQHYCRSVIISIDERARDMDKTYNLKCIDRSEIESKLESYINSLHFC